MYSRDDVRQKKCVCGKTFNTKSRRIIARLEDAQTASEKVRELQEEKFGEPYFTTADKV
jgi:hypothetical protein